MLYEGLPLVEKVFGESTFEATIVELCNILGVEELATESIDWNRPPNDILKETLEEGDSGFQKAIPLFPPIDGAGESQTSLSESEAQLEIMRRICHLALLTAYERIPPSDRTYQGDPKKTIVQEDATEIFATQHHPYTDKVDHAAADINSMREAPKYYKDKVINHAITRNLYDLLNTEFGYPKKDNYIDSAEHSFLRLPPEEDNPNCIAQAAIAISTCYALGVPREDIRVTLAGFHTSVMLRQPNDRSHSLIYDPRKPHLYIILGLKSVYNEHVPTEVFFNNYSLEDLGITTAVQFIKETGYMGQMAPADKEGRQAIHFFAPEDGILAAIYTNLGRVAQEHGDINKENFYYDMALRFDPENSYIPEIRTNNTTATHVT